MLENDLDENGVDAFVPHGLDITASGTNIAYQPNPGGETPSMGEDSNHKVNGSLTGSDNTAPTISSISITSDPGDDDTYVEDDSIEVTVIFNESVIVTETPQLKLDFDGESRTADYSSANGTRRCLQLHLGGGRHRYRRYRHQRQ